MQLNLMKNSGEVALPRSLPNSRAQPEALGRPRLTVIGSRGPFLSWLMILNLGIAVRLLLLVSPLRAQEPTRQEVVDPRPLLWKQESTELLPKASELTQLSDVEFHVIKAWEPDRDQYHWLHGVALAWHHGQLFASFGHNVGKENTLTEEARFCVSDDGGRSWSDVKTIDSGLDDPNLAVSHGVFLNHDGALWAFLGAFYDTRQQVHTRAYRYDDRTQTWNSLGTVVENGFWPMTEPVKMEDGNYLMPGFQVGHGNRPAVAISRGDELLNWELVVLSTATDLGTTWGESTVLVRGQHVINVARYGQQPFALHSESHDYGRSWSPSRISNLPMATSKPCAGVVSTGHGYLVCTTTSDSGKRRSPLTIALTDKQNLAFSRVAMIRDAVSTTATGESHPAASLAYPYAIEHEGKLYIGYSNSGGRGGNQNSAELAIIPVESLIRQLE